jgi:hypothetical protein
MSIAELIMQGTNRASESTAWVGDSLAKLGQNVGKVLADREQQKQAQEMLPILQQSMNESMSLAQRGDTAGAYSNFMGLIASNPNILNNKSALPYLEIGLKGVAESGKRYQDSLDFLQKQAYYNAVATKKSGDSTGDANQFTSRFNQARGRGGMPAVDGLPTDTTGYNGMPAAYLNPQTEDDVISLFAPVPEGDSLPESGGVPAMQSGGGTSFGMRDSTTSFGAGAYQPSEETLQQFAEYSDQYDAAKPKQKKAIESQRTIVYDNKDALGRDIQNLDDDQFGFAQLEAGAADPTFVGIQFSRYKLGNVNAKGEQMYNPNTDADASIGRLQEAFNLVNDRPELKDIYTKAGGWKNIELKPITGKQDEDGVKTAPTFEVINKKNPNEKIEVTEDEFSLLGTINKMIPTSQTNDMKIIRIGEEAKPTAEAPAPTQGGLPAVQSQPTAAMPEIPEEAMALQKLVEQGQVAKAGESAKNVEKRIKDIDSQIKKLSAPIFQFGGTTSASGVKTREEKRIKTPEEAEADIQKIIKLKEQKSMLSAQSEGRVFATEEEAKRSTKKFGKGTIIYIAGKPAKVQ